MMKTKAIGTIHLKSGFHYKGEIIAADSDWLIFHDKKTGKDIEIRTDSVDHFVPKRDDD